MTSRRCIECNTYPCRTCGKGWQCDYWQHEDQICDICAGAQRPLTLHCPAGIETLLWYHCRCEPIHQSGVHEQYTEMLLLEEMIRKDENSGSGYRTTSKGAFMVEMLCSTPFPKTIHSDPRIYRPTNQ